MKSFILLCAGIALTIITRNLAPVILLGTFALTLSLCEFMAHYEPKNANLRKILDDMLREE